MTALSVSLTWREQPDCLLAVSDLRGQLGD